MNKLIDFAAWLTLVEDKSTKAEVRKRLAEPKNKNNRTYGLISPVNKKQPVTRCDGCMYLESEAKKRSINKFTHIDTLTSLPKPCACKLNKNSFKAQDGQIFKFQQTPLTLQQATELIVKISNAVKG
jgi:hypothetical protein